MRYFFDYKPSSDESSDSSDDYYETEVNVYSGMDSEIRNVGVTLLAKELIEKPTITKIKDPAQTQFIVSYYKGTFSIRPKKKGGNEAILVQFKIKQIEKEGLDEFVSIGFANTISSMKDGLPVTIDVTIKY